MTYMDSTAEWKLLGTAFNEEYGEKLLPKFSEKLFTEERKYISNAMKQAYLKYGRLTYDGLKLILNGDIPGELFSIPNNVDPLAMLDECARLATKRELYERAQEMISLSKEYNPSFEQIHQVFSNTPVVVEYDSLLTGAASKFLTNLSKKKNKQYEFVDTGLPFLNVRLGGEYRPGTLIVIPADAGSGKTTLVSNSVVRMVYDVDARKVKERPNKSLTFSLEMSKDDLFTKWAADLNDIDSRNIQSGKVTDEEMQAIEDTVILLQQLPIYVIDQSTITLFEIAKAIRDHVKQYKVKVIFIDHLHVINHHTGNDVKDLGEIAQTLRNLAQELGVCVVLLSRANKNGEGIDSIFGSSLVGSIADVVVCIELRAGEGIGTKEALLNFCKNRLGPTGITTILFVGAFQRFMGPSEGAL